jgi:hypothetical protein
MGGNGRAGKGSLKGSRARVLAREGGLSLGSIGAVDVGSCVLFGFGRATLGSVVLLSCRSAMPSGASGPGVAVVSSSEEHAATMLNVSAITGKPRKPTRKRLFDIKSRRGFASTPT